MMSVGQGLSETDFVEGRNVAFEYRWADDEYDRLPELAADLVRRQAGGHFRHRRRSLGHRRTGRDQDDSDRVRAGQRSGPVGLVASLTRPGGNVTGVTFYNTALGPKRIELLRELVPKAGGHRRARESRKPEHRL